MGKIDTDVIMILDEMHLQKEEQYVGGGLIGADKNGELFSGIMTFMIVGLRKCIPWVVKAIPEFNLKGLCIADHLAETIGTVQNAGFRVRGIVSDDHSTNCLAFETLIKKYVSPIQYIVPSPTHQRKNFRLTFFLIQCT